MAPMGPAAEGILQHHAGGSHVKMTRSDNQVVALPSGCKVQILQEAGARVMVAFNSAKGMMEGWIDAGNVQRQAGGYMAAAAGPAPMPAMAPAPGSPYAAPGAPGAPSMGIARQAEGHPTVVLRAAPQTGAEVMQVANGTRLEILCEDANGNMLVSFQGQQGWARSRNIQKLAPPVAQVSGVMGLMSQNLNQSVTPADVQADINLQHELLNVARDGNDWDTVKRMLKAHPEHINCQPPKHDGTRRWSVLHQAAMFGEVDAVTFLLEQDADVTLTSFDGKTALDVADRSVLPLLQAHKPKPPCIYGEASFVMEPDHRNNFWHPKGAEKRIMRSAANTRERFGAGEWELNVSGNLLDGKWVRLDEHFLGDAALSAVVLERRVQSKCLLFLNDVTMKAKRNNRSETITCEVEVDMISCYCSIPEKGELGRPLLLGIRRVSTSGAPQYPPGEGHDHPFYRVSIELKRNPNEWLTQEFFFSAFEQAIQASNPDFNFAAYDIQRMFNQTFNEDWFGKTAKDCQVERRGGVLYRPPYGWKRFALDVSKYGEDSTWMGMRGEPGEWAVAYHGTAMDIIPLIIKNGFRVGGGQGAAYTLDVRTNRPVGSGVFCTPNITTVEIYAHGGYDGGSEQRKMPQPLADPATGDKHTLLFALQCRVRPEAIRRPERHFSINNDEEIMGIDGVFEWVINNPEDIRPYAILVKEKNPADHRTLYDLIHPAGPPDCQPGHHKWNRDHKPLPFGSFDHLPGRNGTNEQIQASYMQAQKIVR